MKKLISKILLIIVFTIGLSSPVSGEKWKKGCETCEGDRKGSYFCTTTMCSGKLNNEAWINSKDFQKILKSGAIEIGFRFDGVIIWRAKKK